MSELPGRSSTCRGCGTSESACAALGVWEACCQVCDDTDRRSHPSTQPSAGASGPPAAITSAARDGGPTPGAAA